MHTLYVYQCNFVFTVFHSLVGALVHHEHKRTLDAQWRILSYRPAVVSAHIQPRTHSNVRDLISWILPPSTPRILLQALNRLQTFPDQHRMPVRVVSCGQTPVHRLNRCQLLRRTQAHPPRGDPRIRVNSPSKSLFRTLVYPIHRKLGAPLAL